MALNDTNDFFSHSNRYKLPKKGLEMSQRVVKSAKNR
jgi:hypothetical protein